MEAKVRRLLAGALFLAAPCIAQTPGAGQLEWRSDALDLRFAYPSDLVRRDPVEALKDGHLMVYGLPGTQIPALASATRCLKPLLSLELPTSGGEASKTQIQDASGGATVTVRQALLGVILLADLDINCMTPEEQAKARELQTSMVAIVTQVPGMHAMMQPALYTVGNQKVHVAAAQGLPNVQEDPNAPADPLLSYTMAFSTSWNNHLLVWYFSSNSSATLNRITKSTVKFGKAKEAPLYPVQIGYRGR